MAFTSTEPAHIVASFRSGDTVLYDLEAGSALLTLDSRGNSGKGGPRNASRAPVSPVALVTCCPVNGKWLPCPLGGSERDGDQVPVTAIMDGTVCSGGLTGETSRGTRPRATWWSRRTVFVFVIPPARPEAMQCPLHR